MAHKYIITNGKRWVTDVAGNSSVKTSSSATFAKEYWYEKARGILLTNKSLDGYYLEGVEDYFKMTKEDLMNGQKNMPSKSDDSAISMLLNEVGVLVGDICAINIPDKKVLLEQKNSLMQSLQWHDLALADIDHWVQNNKPPAHIRAKVYEKHAYHRNLHTEIKEKIRFLEVLLEFHDNKTPFNNLVGKLQRAETSPYTPNTSVYEELDALMMPTRRTI